MQANFLNDPARPLKRDGVVTTIHNEHLKSPANVVCRHAEGVVFDRLHVYATGRGRLDIEQGSRECQVTGCRFSDISGSAIQIGDVRKDDHHPDDQRRLCGDNAVQNCLIHDCCVEYKGGVGVFVGYTQRTTVSTQRNPRPALYRRQRRLGLGRRGCRRRGLRCRGPFYQKPTACRENRSRTTTSITLCGTLQDGGGIYTLGNQPGTIIRGNHSTTTAAAPADLPGRGQRLYRGYRQPACTTSPTPMNYNNRAQNRTRTCKEHDNFFGAAPNVFREDEATAASAGLEPSYHDLMQTAQ